mmetsp:Transcript_81485/g.186487  ORF Transcript_81485/g.186487 Transcript_81485/m.186487 type:complete len:280 (-) Transcript_81485:260-1099(-)|eukprot:CAMPEP_0204336710 /NCGR_PEP_ID=MMETSP0469-20131031/19737_1 /ASSEMBLY_ACC=CAM_ASM_000384 /TAXON_ID=2969 /ORGANISM="Oxyrrhis marina" /LENGTH=279 /DNA_ID=CAMNT_0051320623 /DNA_START=640 /DNA_END=1479 /DNA_ORIENTATION=+
MRLPPTRPRPRHPLRRAGPGTAAAGDRPRQHHQRRHPVVPLGVPLVVRGVEEVDVPDILQRLVLRLVEHHVNLSVGLLVDHTPCLHTRVSVEEGPDGGGDPAHPEQCSKRGQVSPLRPWPVVEDEHPLRLHPPVLRCQGLAEALTQALPLRILAPLALLPVRAQRDARPARQPHQARAGLHQQDGVHPKIKPVDAAGSLLRQLLAHLLPDDLPRRRPRDDDVRLPEGADVRQAAQSIKTGDQANDLVHIHLTLLACQSQHGVPYRLPRLQKLVPRQPRG